MQLAYTGISASTARPASTVCWNHRPPFDPFGGYRDANDRVLSLDGMPLRSRDRRSHAFLNQVAFAYEGNFWEDMVHVSAGVRSPFMTRDLNQLCYGWQVTGASSVGFPTCTQRQPTSAVRANSTVTLPQAPSSHRSLFVPPAQKTVNFNRILPNLGFTFSPFGPSTVLCRLCRRPGGAAHRQPVQWRQQRQCASDGRRFQPTRRAASIPASRR